MTTPTTRAAQAKHRRLRFVALALAAVPLTLAACGTTDSAEAPTPTVATLDAGGSGDAGTDNSESSESAAPLTEEQIDEAMLRYDQCLRENGVDIGTSGQGESLDGDRDNDGDAIVIDDAFAEDNAEAFATCEPIIEGVFGSFEPTPEEAAEMADAEAAFQNCMGAAGFDVSSEDGMITDDNGSAEMEEALNRCADEAFGALENGTELGEGEEG